MIRPPRRRMTISELKRAMDRRFDRLERTKVDKSEFRRAIASLRTGLKRVERTKVDKAEFRRAITGLRTGLRGEIVTSAAETRRCVAASCDSLRSSLRDEIASSAAETRRHFDVVAEAIRDDIRILAEALASHGARLDK